MRKLTAGLVGLALTVTAMVALPSAAQANAGIGPWETRTAPNLQTWSDITYGNGLFVAVSTDGSDQVMTSPDGFTWTARSTPAPGGTDWSAVAYGEGLFVAVSSFGDLSMSSPDGITWTQTNLPSARWLSIAYGEGKFVALSDTTVAAVSDDGLTWTQTWGFSNNDWSVAYGGGTFVAVGTDYGVGVNQVMYSLDGVNWNQATASNENEWTSVTYGDGVFVAVACGCLAGQVMTSLDGITWTGRVEAATSDWSSVTYGDGLFVAVAQDRGFDDADQVMTSRDGTTWTLRSAPDNYWTSVAYGAGLFASVALSNATEQVMISYTPSVTTTSPSSGIPGGGTTVTLTGTSLADASAVTFGGIAASSFTVNSATRITAVTPAHAVGAVDVAVTTPGGTATKTSGFTYAVPTPDPPPAPTPTPTPTPTPAPVVPVPVPVLGQQALLVRFTGESSRVTVAQRERIQAFVDAQPGVIVSTRIVGFATDDTRAARRLARERALATARVLTNSGVAVDEQPARLNGNGDIETFPGRAGRVFVTLWTVS